jgi:hypothetical protein
VHTRLNVPFFFFFFFGFGCFGGGVAGGGWGKTKGISLFCSKVEEGLGFGGTFGEWCAKKKRREEETRLAV